MEIIQFLILLFCILKKLYSNLFTLYLILITTHFYLLNKKNDQKRKIRFNHFLKISFIFSIIYEIKFLKSQRLREKKKLLLIYLSIFNCLIRASPNT